MSNYDRKERTVNSTLAIDGVSCSPSSGASVRPAGVLQPGRLVPVVKEPRRERAKVVKLGTRFQRVAKPCLGKQ